MINIYVPHLLYGFVIGTCVSGGLGTEKKKKCSKYTVLFKYV